MPPAAAGREYMDRMLVKDHLRDTVVKYGSVFNALQIICNRETPPHRDARSRAPWYDLLASVGPYTCATLNFNITASYGPGSVVELSGKVLRHSVPKFQGDRTCFTYFMRDSVHSSMHVKAPGWSEVEDLELNLIAMLNEQDKEEERKQ